MSPRSCLSIVLAAGEGTRMKSGLPKVLHPVAGLPMLAHVVRAVEAAGGDEVAIVVGHGGDKVKAAAEGFAPQARFFEQTERLGTAHAVLAARDAIAQGFDDVLVVFGDTPLLAAAELAAARERLVGEDAAVVVLGFRPEEPGAYGRLVETDGRLVAIREAKDCTAAELAIDFCNSGLMVIDGKHALELLEAVGNDNAKGEFYLTDIVEIANARGLKAIASQTGVESALGINSRAELAQAETVWQQRRRRDLMLAGVTMLAPETVHLSHDTEIEADALIEPNVVFGPGVRVAAGARIRAFSHLEGAHVAGGAEIGPFARLRPGTDIGGNAKVGNFCEVKNVVLEEGAKVNHLTYVGDAHIGAKANIGAGTITCNYDGVSKHRTEIGAGAFVGSNTSLVAPLTIGEGAFIASGSVITSDVPADSLAFGRARQVTKEGRASRLRALKKASS
ncbi:bifunctional UDP-N-acetylglucosamine diphosphorylase/glucosamine-1-phosphate N-acetyltransferase GlmU [Chelativorans sp. ZYF759]|uniref:bifunctional UDP-N-acetylglucosamine diphosphorylase/glucosamine-1-phosphate N-acetyltransferase GlmU n=1 Tax=Chelativorans sp. ZYF759 TaxID=2692213 RepID=UPI00145D4567|nr:bifunctional UDP-N-acetylglucosamine diphosphorylase/glucosamine-1-phosphate N-acetyltransferase GlmU [Chelativorans sp. ZYF759]NMG38693.1 bifunctional UDP-N-acetylglucosamine diphosphorylase/glucosamine-1-phosphate N-acetyltransferase GlmU [Chelativorans sp. ZYF759]